MRRLAALTALAAAGALVLTGCGGGSDGSPSASDTGKESLHDLLPDSIKKAGVITVGAEMAYPPMEFVRNGKPAGIDPDLAAVLGDQLGVKFQFDNSTFDTLLTAQRHKSYDIVMSALNDTPERQEGVNPATGERTGEGVDFVDYLTSGSSILVKKGNPEGIRTLKDLCGKKVAAQSGSTTYDLLQAQDCAEPMKIQAVDSFGEAQSRLEGGSVVAGVADFPVAGYAGQSSGGGKDFELAGEQIEPGPYGIAVLKSNTELRDALEAALNAAIQNGSYGKVLAKWNVTDGAVGEATINGGS
ncbi:ABC transporter substrate-binding protein [Streptomyces sp. NPDC059378]|uniref:ABC transporter substrate-binding protein n=1 Tax=Streptomyces sp. NPDC059378 TaxID=3346815 RepID=UPI0036A741A6